LLPRRLLLLLLIPAGLIVMGTLGYHVIEGWSLFDSLYRTVLTLTTVEAHVESTAGRAFTIVLLLVGVFTLLYAAMEFIRAIVSGEVQAVLGRQRMQRSLSGLSRHLIVCGYGRMGRLVCKEFAAEGLAFVVIEKNQEQLASFQEPHGIALCGDATHDDLLKKARIDQARALITVLGSDADNLLITMSARLLNEKIHIVARAENELAENKLARAGANRVVSPYVIGGLRVAHAVLRPTVMDFIELATRTEHLELQIEETKIAPPSPLAGSSLRDSRLRQDQGIIIVAIKKASGHMAFNPPADAVIEAGDILITLGNRAQLDELDALASGREGARLE
jgi:voltage-gated potassium channel